MTQDEERPTPEALLDAARREGRGRLKIFLGAAPGVGKTYAMLQAAHQRRASGIDVVVGIVETHGRAETEALLAGLPAVPLRPLAHRGRVFREVDLDALLARRPALALIDELAHSNVPGSRHPKRWQDVEELLAAGIDVYTTLNVQHLESLNDSVARISGVRVQETLPDQVLALADEIELIDLPPDELIERLRAGKVYVEGQAAQAIQNFFAKGNLTALREIALRVAADRVDAQMAAHMRSHAIPGPWPTADRILVCLNEGPVAKTLVRAAKRMADRARVPWLALHVVTPGYAGLPEAAKDRIAEALRLAESLGAEGLTLHSEGPVAEEILRLARQRNVSRLVIGRPRPRRLLGLFREGVTGRLLRKAADFEVTLVSADGREDGGPPIGPALPSLERRPAPYLKALLATLATAGLAWLIQHLLPVASLSLVFITGVLAVAVRYGLWPSLAASLLSFGLYNFFFTEPYHTFFVTDENDVLTLGLFLLVAVLTGNLAGRLKAQAQAQRAIARRTETLHAFARRIASAATRDDVVWAAVHHVAVTLGCRALMLLPDAEGRIAIAGGYPPEDRLEPRDQGAADWAWEHREPAGWGSATLPAAAWFFLPLESERGPLGLLGIAFERRSRGLSPDERRLIDALVGQVALAIERTRLVEDLEETRLLSETERLRAALLSSVSHDLRTPLVSIIGAATSLESLGATLDPTARAELTRTVLEEAARLNRFVQNLLDMTRLGYGGLQLRRDWIDLGDVVGGALRQLGPALSQHRVELVLPPDLPLAWGDPVLLEQVLVNVLDNAAKYAPRGSRIRVEAEAGAEGLLLRVADEGPGIAPADRERVFDMFYRVRAGDGQRAGTGLGLSICRAFVEAHGGRIRALSGPQGTGTVIELWLPPGAAAPAAEA